MKRRNEMKFVTCPGSRIHLHYEARHDGQRLVLEASGSTDIQDEIESFGKYTDLHYMLHRLAVGDKNVISSRPPIYGDFSSLPANPIDAINLVHSAERRFGALSVEDRASFNNDYRNWLAAVLSGNVPRKDSVSHTSASDTVKEIPKNEP